MAIHDDVYETVICIEVMMLRCEFMEVHVESMVIFKRWGLCVFWHSMMAIFRRRDFLHCL